ncbi:MAG: sialidase family protein, partial [Planctomycetota bacterium]
MSFLHYSDSSYIGTRTGKIRLVRVAICVCLGIVVSALPSFAVDVVKDGAAQANASGLLIDVDAGAWTMRDGHLVGKSDHFLSRLAIDEGDFRAVLRLRIEGDSSKSSVAIGTNRVAFAKGKLELFGPLFGGEPVVSLKAGFDPAKAFQLEVIRRGTPMQILLDDEVMHTVEGHRERLGAISLRSVKGTMWLKDLSVDGKTYSLPARQKPEYSIPTLDISADKERQVVVDREKGQYLGHPTTVLLEDGKTVIAVYPKGHGRGGIVMKRSRDGGKTWSGRLPVPTNWSTSREVPTIYRTVDASGVKRLIMFSGLYPVRLSVSDDDGLTWTGLKSVGDFGGIVTMASLVKRRDGTYVSYFHDDGRFLKGSGKRGPFVVYHSESKDGGLTWGAPKSIAQHERAHLCEPGIVRSPDRRQLAMLLRENSRRYNSFVCFSGDDGETWTEPVELPASLTGDRHVGRYLPDGRLLLTFRDTTRTSPTKGDWVAWVGTYDDIVQGREGQYRVRLMDNHRGADCAYPGLEVLPDGT